MWALGLIYTYRQHHRFYYEQHLWTFWQENITEPILNGTKNSYVDGMCQRTWNIKYLRSTPQPWSYFRDKIWKIALEKKRNLTVNRRSVSVQTSGHASAPTSASPPEAVQSTTATSPPCSGDKSPDTCTTISLNLWWSEASLRFSHLFRFLWVLTACALFLWTSVVTFIFFTKYKHHTLKKFF